MQGLRRAAAALGALLLGFTPAALARPPGPPGPHGPPERFIEANAERLGLDEETLAAITAISEDSRERSEALREQLFEAHRKMHELLDADEPDEAAVMAQADATGALEVELRKERLRAMLRIRRLLTPEQRQELVRIREEMGPPHWRERRGGPPDDLPPPP